MRNITVAEALAKLSKRTWAGLGQDNEYYEELTLTGEEAAQIIQLIKTLSNKQ